MGFITEPRAIPKNIILMGLATFVLMPTVVLALWSVAAAPSPRHGHRMVYDASQNAVLMFGGRAGEVISGRGLGRPGKASHRVFH